MNGMFAELLVNDDVDPQKGEMHEGSLSGREVDLAYTPEPSSMSGPNSSTRLYHRDVRP